MRVSSTTQAPPETGADTIAVGVFEGERIAHDVDGALQGLVDSGEARAGLRKVAVAHAGGNRYVLAGLGKRDEFDPERARVAAAAVAGRARELGTRRLCWEIPHHVDARGFVEGTVLAAYEYLAYKSEGDDDPRIEELVVSAHHDTSAEVDRAAAAAEAANAARDLQNAPANEMTPSALAERARALPGLVGRGLGPGRDRGGRHGRLRRRGAGHPPGAAADHPALRATRRHRPTARPRRQGRDLRLRRHLDQARPEDERDEVRHVGRRGRPGGDRARSPGSGCPPA